MIIFDRVTKQYLSGGGVQEISFEVGKGELLVLLGPSGSGKTTALRLVNRLIEPDAGGLLLDGVDVRELDPIALRRKIGYAIQHIGLILHMTVEENIGIVPKLLGWPEKKIQARTDELLSLMGLEPSEYRDVLPKRLSGGQRQRVGVARALAADPPVILMDEPFGALDPLMRQQLQDEFLAIQSEIHKTVLFVTHDLHEAVKMGDRIAIFHEGKIAELATPKELIQKPSSPFVEEFLGQDRFRLLLQTQSLESLVSQLQKEQVPKKSSLTLGTTFIEALHTFRETGSDKLPVYDNEDYVGELTKETLIATLTGSL